MRKPRRIFRKRRQSDETGPAEHPVQGSFRRLEAAGLIRSQAGVDLGSPCDICGRPSDGWAIKYLQDNIARGVAPYMAMCRACGRCRAHAERDPEWGRSITDQLGRDA
jgi:hypothetical protein